jgi:hypothetical protein
MWAKDMIPVAYRTVDIYYRICKSTVYVQYVGICTMRKVQNNV